MEKTNRLNEALVQYDSLNALGSSLANKLYAEIFKDRVDDVRQE